MALCQPGSTLGTLREHLQVRFDPFDSEVDGVVSLRTFEHGNASVRWRAGLDTEDIQPLRNGLFIASDEYGKVIILDGEGKIHMTYIPHGAGGKITEENTGSPVKELLPPSFNHRRANRGLENLAVSGDRTRAYTCQQVPPLI